MFCTTCGKQIPDQARFCANCGAAVHPATPIVPPPVLPAEKPVAPVVTAPDISLKDYFSSACSPEATKRQKTLRILYIISAVVQLILAVLMLFGAIKTVFQFQKLIEEDYISAPIAALIGTLALPLLFRYLIIFLSLLLARKGIQKKSRGLLFASLFFTLLSGKANTNTGGIFDWLVTIPLCLLHVAMMVLVSKDIYEYKSHLLDSQSVKE